MCVRLALRDPHLIAATAHRDKAHGTESLLHTLAFGHDGTRPTVGARGMARR
jgi:hypothetical protein